MVAVAAPRARWAPSSLQVLHDVDFRRAEVRVASARSRRGARCRSGCGQVPAGDLTVQVK